MVVVLVLALLSPLPPDGSGGLEVLELVVVAFPWTILLCLVKTSWVRRGGCLKILEGAAGAVG